MDFSSFLAVRDSQLARSSDPRLVSAEPRRVVAEAVVRGSGTDPVAPSSAMVMALADCASAYGAMRHLPAGYWPSTIEAKIIHLRQGRGRVLRADASPIHLGEAVSVWRAGIYLDESQIAEVTQTLASTVASPTGGEAEPAVDDVPPTDATRSFARSAISKTFSDEVVLDRLAQIFDAACIVVAERGFAKASIRQIAEQADMPVATLYQYIDSKDDILRMIYEYFAREITQEIDKVAEMRLAPRPGLEELVRRIMQLFDQQDRSIRIIFQESRGLSREDRQKVFAADGEHIRSIERFLTSGIEAEGWRIERPHVVANFIWFLCSIWPLRHWALRQHGMKTVVDNLVDFIMRAIETGPNK